MIYDSNEDNDQCIIVLLLPGSNWSGDRILVLLPSSCTCVAFLHTPLLLPMPPCLPAPCPTSCSATIYVLPCACIPTIFSSLCLSSSAFLALHCLPALLEDHCPAHHCPLLSQLLCPALLPACRLYLVLVLLLLLYFFYHVLFSTSLPM